MKPLKMDEAVEYFRDKRDAVTHPANANINTKPELLFSLAIFLSLFVIVLLIGFLTPPANWDNWTNHPLGFGFRIGLFGVALSVILYPLVAAKSETVKKVSRGKLAENPFTLYLGLATGKLAKLKHGATPTTGKPVVLSANDATANIMIEGGISSGKTTRVMYPLLIQLLDQDCGGLIFDIKGNFKHAVESAANAVGEKGQRVKIIGPDKTSLNLLKGLSPEVAASNLKSALMLTEKDHKGPWINTAADWCQSALGVLSYIPEFYSLNGLYRYLYDAEFHARIDSRVQAVLDSLSDKEARVLESYLDYQDNIFSSFDERFTADVKATVAQVIGPFTHPDLVDAFCTELNQVSAEMEKVTDGTVYLVELPLAKWGMGAKVAYTFLKLRFFSVMQHRQLNVSYSDRPVFFMCDEYQNIISANPDGLSDFTFWDKSRESRCIGLVSWQGISSVYASLGNRDIADAIMQHFRQHIAFRTEDDKTLAALAKQLGKVEVEQHSTSTSKSSTGSRSSQAKSKGTSKTKTDVLDPQVIRKLGPDEAVAILNIGGYAQDEILEFTPIYVDPPKTETPEEAAA